MKRRKRSNKHVLRSQIEVDCPRWLQKRMRASLKRARKDKVNPARAKIAKALWESTKAEVQVAIPQKTDKANRGREHVHVAQPAQSTVRSGRSKVWQLVKAGFGKLVKHISGSIKGKRVLRPAHLSVKQISK